MNYIHTLQLIKIFARAIQGIATWNSWEKIKSAIPHELNYADWLFKNSKTVFSKLTWKISLSVSGEQTSKHSTWSFPFSEFLILSSLLSCYFSEIYCAFCFRQMFNGFWTSNFDFYWKLTLQFSCITVRLSKGRFLFAVASDYISFSKNWT